MRLNLLVQITRCLARKKLVLIYDDNWIVYGKGWQDSMECIVHQESPNL